MGFLFSDDELAEIKKGKPEPVPEPKPVTEEDWTRAIFVAALSNGIDLYLNAIREYPRVAEVCGRRPVRAYEGSQHRKAKRKYALSSDFTESLYYIGNSEGLTKGFGSDSDALYVSSSGKLYGFWEARVWERDFNSKIMFERYEGSIWADANKERSRMGKGQLIRLYSEYNSMGLKIINSRIGTYRAYLGVLYEIDKKQCISGCLSVVNIGRKDSALIGVTSVDPHHATMENKADLPHFLIALSLPGSNFRELHYTYDDAKYWYDMDDFSQRDYDESIEMLKQYLIRVARRDGSYYMDSRMESKKYSLESIWK